MTKLFNMEENTKKKKYCFFYSAIILNVSLQIEVETNLGEKNHKFKTEWSPFFKKT